MNNKSKDPTLNLYNPPAQDPDALLAEFIDRKNLLARILDIVRHNTADKPQQHVILLGPRGMGKTTLLCALKYRVERDEALNKEWLPIQFYEEQYGIGDLTDFWLEALRHLETELNSRPSIVDQLQNEASDQLEAQAQEQFFQLLAQSGKRVLLLVDNINDIFTSIDDGIALNKLRTLWMTDPRMMIVGAAPSYFEEITEVGEAFHDFFRILSLDRLTQKELEAFMRHFAEIQGDKQVIHAIEYAPQRIAAMRILTGGNPRLVKLGYRVLREGLDGDVRHDLERLLDECTPFFKHRIESLAKEARRTFDAIARRWDPVTVNEIRLELRKESNYISAQIKRLIAEGFVEEVGGTKKKRYQVSERFYNVYYLMRHSREGRRRLGWLVGFMQVFYTHNDFKHWAKRMGDELNTPLAEFERSEKLSFLHALSAAADKDGRYAAFDAMMCDAITRDDRSAVNEAFASGDPIKNYGFRYFSAEALWFLEAETRRRLGFKPDAGYWWRRLRQTLIKFGLMTKIKSYLTELDEWHMNTSHQARAVGVVLNWLLNEKAAAEVAYRKAIKIDPQHALAWNSLGNVLREQGRYTESETAYREALELDPQSVIAWNNLGNVFGDQGHHAEAEAAFLKAIDLDPQHAGAWNNLCGNYLLHLNQPEAGISALLKGLSLDPENSYGHYVLGQFWQMALTVAAQQIVVNESGADNLRQVFTEALLGIATAGQRDLVREALEALDESTQQPFEALLLALQALDDRAILYRIAREKRDLVLDVMARIAPDDAIDSQSNPPSTKV